MGKHVIAAPPAALPSLDGSACPECGHDMPGRAGAFGSLAKWLHLPSPKVRCRVELEDTTGWGAPECGCAHTHHG